MTWTSIASDLTLDGVVGRYSPPPAAPITYQPQRVAPKRGGIGAFIMGVGASIIAFALFSPHAPSPEETAQAAAVAALQAAPVEAEPPAPAEPVKGFSPPEAPKTKAPTAEVPQAKLRYDSEPKVRELAPATTASTPAEQPTDGDTQDGMTLEKFRNLSRGL